MFKKKAKKEQPNDGMGGSFVGFVLLDSVAFDAELLVKTLREEWNISIPAEDADAEKQSVVSEIDGMMAAVSLMPAPIPNGEAVSNARTNFRWPEAVAVAEAHKAHLMIAVLRREQNAMDAGKLFVKLCAACLAQPNATGANVVGSVLAPDFYCDFAKHCHANGEFPLMNLVFFGMYQREVGAGISGYTYGMTAFGKQELEVLDSEHQPSEVFDMLHNVASYVLESDVTLRDGETLGYSAEQKLPITESKGAAVDGMTLKIKF